MQWATRSEDYYIRAAPCVEVFSGVRGMGCLFATELGKVTNLRLQAMLEKCLPYNLKFTYIKGEDNNVADFGSRQPRTETQGEEFKIFNPMIQTRSRRVYEKMFDCKDPQVDRIGEIGQNDDKYKRMIFHVTNNTPVREMEEDCELK